MKLARARATHSSVLFREHVRSFATLVDNCAYTRATRDYKSFALGQKAARNYLTVAHVSRVGLRACVIARARAH